MAIMYSTEIPECRSATLRRILLSDEIIADAREQLALAVKAMGLE